MKRQRQIKVVATLGPASESYETIESLFIAGADVFRINMSHMSHDDLASLTGNIRQVEEKQGRPIAIMVDLQGPKLRIGEFTEGRIELVPGARFRLDGQDRLGDQSRVFLPHPEILNAIDVGHNLLLDDGKIRLKVHSKECDHIVTTVEVGGMLSNRKGVSVPDTEVPITSMTDKDREDLNAALKFEPDWVALSFVQRPDDIDEARQIIGNRANIIAKIEKPKAIEGLDQIITQADGLMIARGDLGVEMPLERVPGWQKRIIRAARQAGKPVIVATQMLESMISASAPTRAEVSDVASAVYEGADAIMLSAESAVGDYPIEAVKMMDRIAIACEGDSQYEALIHALRTEPKATGADTISAAARQIVERLDLAAIVCYTKSGGTGLRAARERPLKPIIALSPIRATVRRLSLIWGLHCVISADAKNEADMVDRACRIALSADFANIGERVIITAGIPFGTPGQTNMLRICDVEASHKGEKTE